MKPTVLSFEARYRREIAGPRRISVAFPKTDYSFQPPLHGDFDGRCGRVRVPSFLSISENYFKNEARGNFAIEALFFGLLVTTAAVPVFQGVRGLFQFVYSVL